MPAYLRKRFQRVKNCAVGFVLGRYSSEENILDLKWLPVKERIESNIAKLAFKAINYPNMSGYLSVNTKTHNRVLRSSSNGATLEIPSINKTFEYSTANTFDNLPIQIRENYNYNSFVNAANLFYAEGAFDRICNV